MLWEAGKWKDARRQNSSIIPDNSLSFPCCCCCWPRYLMRAAGSSGRSHGVPIAASGSNLKLTLCLLETNPSQPPWAERPVRSGSCQLLTGLRWVFVLKDFTKGLGRQRLGYAGKHSNESHFSFFFFHSVEMLYSEQHHPVKTPTERLA